MNRIIFTNAEGTAGRIVLAAHVEQRPVHDGPPENGDFVRLYDEAGDFIGFEMEDMEVPAREIATAIPPNSGDVLALYKALIAQGVEPEPFVEPAPAEPAPTPVPTSASRLGIKRALEARGLWTAVRAAIMANPVVQEEWELATELFPTDPLVVGMVGELVAMGVPIDVPTLLVEAAAAVAPPP